MDGSTTNAMKHYSKLPSSREDTNNSEIRQSNVDLARHKMQKRFLAYPRHKSWSYFPASLNRRSRAQTTLEIASVKPVVSRDVRAQRAPGLTRPERCGKFCSMNTARAATDFCMMTRQRHKLYLDVADNEPQALVGCCFGFFRPPFP